MDEFSVKRELNGTVMVVTISGRVDSVSAVKLESELAKVVNESKKIVLDLKDVVYMSSAGVRTVVRASQSAQKSAGGVKLADIRERVMQVFQTNVGMTEMLQIYPSVDEAVASFS